MSDDKEIMSGGAVDMKSQEKKGGKYCGCCCDYRRAVFVFSILGIISGISGFITAIVEWDPNVVLAAGNAISVVVYGISFYGALKYNVAALAIEIAYIGIWFVISTVLSIMDESDSVGTMIGKIVYLALATALAMYPAIFLIKEIKAGIMTEETYPREAHSCCCSPKV